MVVVPPKPLAHVLELMVQDRWLSVPADMFTEHLAMFQNVTEPGDQSRTVKNYQFPWFTMVTADFPTWTWAQIEESIQFHSSQMVSNSHPVSTIH
jgi:hypothetical protein